ncbi:MAG: DUF92 domain-containing protein [Vulcanimicrobiaceae bacterium]
MIALALGALAATAIAVMAYRAHALDRGGAIAAIVVGTATYGALGFGGAATLLAFFVTSVALSRVGRARKRALLVDVDKTGARDAVQVLANGGIAALCAVLAHALGSRYACAFAGALAAATADTWGTEIGTLARGAPRSILTLRRLATGLSGGVTVVGTLAEVAGALAIAGVARATGSDARSALAIAAGGMAGALADSILGASVQTLRWCPHCGRATERDPHVCGTATETRRGVSWFGNDAVNATATLVGAAVAFALCGE